MHIKDYNHEAKIFCDRFGIKEEEFIHMVQHRLSKMVISSSCFSELSEKIERFYNNDEFSKRVVSFFASYGLFYFIEEGYKNFGDEND